MLSISSVISAASTSSAGLTSFSSAELAEINKISSNWSNSQKVESLRSAVLKGQLHVTRYLLDNHISDYDQISEEQKRANEDLPLIYGMAVCRSNQNSMKMVKLLNQYGLDFMPSAFLSPGMVY